MVVKRLQCRLILLICIIGLIASCGPIKRGILLASHDENSIPSGSVVNIYDESALRSSYEIRYRDRQQKVQKVNVESWRIRVFQNANALESFRQEYIPFAPYFGVTEIQALPVREAMNTNESTAIIYRLQKDERVKILSQTESKVEVGGLNDYWFEVLTLDGTQGYVYGYRLDKVDASGISVEEKKDIIEKSLLAVLENEWRPEYFRWMIDEESYDLELFRNEYRFYHDDQLSRFVLTTAEYDINFEYEELFRARYKEYLAIGSNLHISVYNENRISIQYTVDGEAAHESLVRIEEDVEQIIDAEYERRQLLLDSFLSQGKKLVSNQYGNIRFTDDGSGVWQTIIDLSIAPEWFTGTFQLAFPLYITPNLRDSYDGALSFTKEGLAVHENMNFLYSFTNNGLQLEFIPSRNIATNMVERRARSPLIIFFYLSAE